SPVLGRTFSNEEDQPGGHQVLVMSYGLWQGRFGRDPSILGKSVTMAGAPYTVIGVLSPKFQPPAPSADIWLPLQADPTSTDQAHILMVAGRLPRATTLAQANAWMTTVGKRYIQAHPEQLGNDDKIGAIPTQRYMTGDVRPALLMLFGAVGLVLMIACANVANLFLARALGRQREIAIRAAIGAGRRRIIHQLLSESILLALAGGAAGLTVGYLGVRAILALAPAGLPRTQELAALPPLDPWVAGFTLLVSLITGVAFGLLPALQLSRPDLTAFLKESGTISGASAKQYRARGTLVSAELALAVILLSAAVLLIRSFLALHRVQPGFDPKDLLTMKVALAGAENAHAVDVARLASQVSDRVHHLPGVEAVTIASSLPTQPIVDMIFDVPGRPLPADYKFTGDVFWEFISWSYFDAMRIPLKSGRLFREQEPHQTVIINEAMARKFWPKQNPVGQSIVIGAGLGDLDQGPTEVVGVVGDVCDTLYNGPPPIMYRLWSQVPDGAIRLMSRLYPASLAVRTRPGVAPMSVAKAVQQCLLGGEMQLPATKIETMEGLMVDSTSQTNFDMLLLGVFAALALLLAAVGVFGVASYAVRQRTREIAVRMALGASNRDVIQLVLGQGIVFVLAGVGLGVAGALGFTRLMSSLLYGVRSTDPLTFLAVSATLAISALIACYIPARRATKVDPMVALRYE
ncbi:MAG TPA: ABC transporter permease, partial [Terriglobia bacterium]|nr:ABC transporter permease [Terriglobia bacterium]